MERYIQLFIEGIILGVLYFLVDERIKNYNPLIFARFVLFYIFVVKMAGSFGVNESIVTLVFISRIISMYVDMCSQMDVALSSIGCETGQCAIVA